MKMEQLMCKHSHREPQVCRQGERSITQVSKMSITRHLLLVAMAFLIYTLDHVKAYGKAETLCGGELVDTLQFVCGDRGFYFSRPTRSSRRTSRGIVEECCFRSCDLELLEMYCAKSTKNERDLSTAPATAVPSLNKDMFHKHSHSKYSKYEIWQRKSTQRLRRGIPAIIRARQYRWQVKQIEEAEQTALHRPLTLPMKRPIQLRRTSESFHN
ncbi:insulin-like growth factor II [Bombina bombina]|uniref:insulin-like growth factor II n=1 Tax=Bombina bombina TaxID=8345 RepID=UPI00235B2C6A|nr:insulin-like growth factor II [Bombina bombina]